MAADLHIHVVTDGITKQVLADFFSNSLGSQYFNPTSDYRRHSAASEKINETPACWIGEVSWLKAALFEDGDAFVPGPVAGVSEAIGEDLPVIDDALIAKIDEAMRRPNTTGYSLADPQEVRTFLEQHRGARCFTISW